MKKRVAVLGSAFNPPSLGHKDVIEQVALEFDEVWLVPSFKHAFGKKMIPYDLRLELLSLFVRDIGSDSVVAMPVEHLIESDGSIYTWDLMSYLQAHNADIEFSIVIGPDNKENWDKFYMAKEIKEKWSLFVAEERVDIRSTYIRERMNENQCLDGLVTSSVECFLDKKHDQCLI